MAPFPIFREAFFDGFTMSGLVGRLRTPGYATSLFARPGSRDDADSVPITLQRTKQGWMVAGDLHDLPEQALRAMMDRLKVEQEGRKAAGKVSEGAIHGASR
jgi:hypothetical protein